MASACDSFLILLIILLSGDTKVRQQSYQQPASNPYGQQQQPRSGQGYPYQSSSQYPGQAGGQYPNSQNPYQQNGQMPGQTGTRYPPGQQFPAGQVGSQYPPSQQNPYQNTNQYPGQGRPAGQTGGRPQYPGQQTGQYPGQQTGQYPGRQQAGQFPGSVGPSCPPLVLPPYGRYLQGPCRSTSGERCYLTCDPGFDVVGSCFRVCNQGRWSGTNLICAKTTVRCPPLTINPGLRLVQGCQNMAGFTCEFGCMNGQTPVGQRIIYCNAMGQWSGRPPTCSSSSMGGSMGGGMNPGQMTGQIPGQGMNPGQGFSAGRGTGMGQGTGSMPQTGMGSRSGTGMKEMGAGSRTGMTGGMNPGSGSRPMTGTSTGAGQSTTVTGKQMDRTTASPAEGRERAKLKATTCLSLSLPAKGQMSGKCSPGLVGQKCVFNCIPGFNLKGRSSLTCQEDGEWDSKVPSCKF